MAKSLSSATGYWMPNFAIAWRTLSLSFSNANSGECTPMITKPELLYCRYQALTKGSARRQLMQEYVQKSMTTTLPRKASRVSGEEFNQPVAPASDGISPSTAASFEPWFEDIMAPPDIAG